MPIGYTAIVAGVAYDFDFIDQRIDIPATVDDLLIPNIWTAIKEAQASLVGITYDLIAEGSGLDDLDPGIESYVTVKLLGWDILSLKTSGKFRTRGGNISRSDGAIPFRSNPLITYMAFQSQAGVVARVETGVSGLTLDESAKLNNLDVAVSTRLAAGDYVAPPTPAGIADAVWAKVLEAGETAADMLRLKRAYMAGAGTIPLGPGEFELLSADGQKIRIKGEVTVVGTQGTRVIQTVDGTL